VGAILVEGPNRRHIFGREPSNDYFIKILFLLSKWFQSWKPSWLEGETTIHNFGRGPSNDYFIEGLFQFSNWFQTRRFLCEFPIGSYVKLSSAVGAIFVEVPNRRTHFWKKTIQ
jgi:hypothetical protein